MGVNSIEPRKLIKFGNSSHIISLPREWLKKNNLNKGDTIFFKENGNGELLVSPVIKDDKKEIKEIVINAENKSMDLLERELMSAYIKNYSVIKIIDQNLNTKLKDIKKIIYGLSAIEIIEQTPNKIVLKDFLDTKAISVDSTIRQMDILTRSMLEDIKKCVKDKDIYESLYERDLDVNKSYFLLWKLFQRAFNDTNFMQSLDSSYSKIVSYWWFVLNLEKIADETKRIAKVLREGDLTKKQYTDFLSIFVSIENDYLKLMKAYYTMDYKLAYEVAGSKKENIQRCDQFLDKNKTQVNVAKTVEKLKGIESYISHMVRGITDLN